MPQFISVCRTDEVLEGEAKLCFAGETAVAVFQHAGRFFALANECPHAGASLAHGLIDGDCVSCRIHHWRFCIRDGRYLDEDKSQYNVRSFRVRVVGDEVQVELSQPADRSPAAD